MTISELALVWLNKQLKQKNIALHNATYKPNRDEEEIGNLLDTIDVIEYLIEIVEEVK